MEIKAEINGGTPLPQRNAKGNVAIASGGNVGGQQQSGGQTGGSQHNQQRDDNNIPEKKGRFNNPQNQQISGGGGGGGNRRGKFMKNQGGRNRNLSGGMKNENDGGGGKMDRRNDSRDSRKDDRGGRGSGNMGYRDQGSRKGEDYLMQQKLKTLCGPTHEIPPIETQETKFSGRNRLYIGNLTNDITEEELKELFKPFGDISEAFISAEKNFAFLKVDYHTNAEKAKRELDGYMRKNRSLRVRFAPNATIIRVKNLTQHVSNELLFKAFEIFGPIERAVIIVDDRGKSTGEGIVEFARKAGAMAAIRHCSEKCYFLTSSLKPCVVEAFEINDDTDGLSDKAMNKKAQDFYTERKVGPRFAEIGTFEHEYGTRWKQLHELFKQKHEALKRELHVEEEKLEAQMEYARYEHETEMLREQLRKREQDRDRQKREWEMKERQAEEMKNREEEQMRRQQEEMQLRMNRQDEELKRRQQENTLFMQAQQLNSLLDQQEMNQGGNGGLNDLGRKFEQNNMNRNFNFGNNTGSGNQVFNPFDLAGQSKQNPFDEQTQNIGSGNAQGLGQQQQQSQQQQQQQRGGNNRQWNDRRSDDFQNKRRRF